MTNLRVSTNTYRYNWTSVEPHAPEFLLFTLFYLLTYYIERVSITETSLIEIQGPVADPIMVILLIIHMTS